MSDDPSDGVGAEGGEPDPDELKPPEPYPRGLARIRRHMIDLSPLRISREFRLLFLGQAVSDLGSEITFVAVPFQVFRLTGSTLAVGLLGLCDLVPLLAVRLRNAQRGALRPVLTGGASMARTAHRSRAAALALRARERLLQPRCAGRTGRGRDLSSPPSNRRARTRSTSRAGVVASAVSVPFSIVSGGLACVLGVAVIAAAVPEFRAYDARHLTA